MTTDPRFHEIEPDELHQMIKDGTAVVVDVREPSEHHHERIAGARLNPVSAFDPRAATPEGGERVVLQCRSGVRSAEAARYMLAAGMDEAFHLRGGIEAWKKAGLPTEKTPGAPVSIMRQVQMVAGSLVLLGTLLGAFLTPWFLLLSGFIGAGLTFAGLSGTCGMASMLGKMPWNRAAAAV